MTRAQIVDRIALATGLTKVETDAVVEGFLVVLADALREGEAVELRGFGTFRAVERAPRLARNPRANTPVAVPRCFEPMFKPAAELRKAVDAARKAAEAGSKAQRQA